MQSGKFLLLFCCFVTSLCFLSGCIPTSGGLGTALNSIKNTAGGNSVACVTNSPAKGAVVSRLEGVATANVNVRDVPNGNKVGGLVKGQKVVISDEKSGWCQISATSGNSIKGWVSGKFVERIPVAAATSGSLSATAGDLTKDLFKNGKVYKGYSKDYQPIKKMIYAGKINSAIDCYECEKSGKSSDDASLPEIDLDNSKLKALHNMELGTMKLEAGRTSESLKHFNVSLNELEMAESDGIVSSNLKKGGLFALETISGNEELQPYEPVGYEKIMLLNYKAIAYLLDGKDEAFNVARRATDWQNMEREAFEEKQKKAEKKLAKEEDKVNAQAKKQQSSGVAGAFSGMTKMKDSLAKAYSVNHKQASTVANPYVNPFADYLRGAVMEYKAQKDTSKIDDAMRAYEEACKLNPKCKMLSVAAKEMKQMNKTRTPGAGNLLHIVVADGFSPEKKVLTNMIPVSSSIITVQLPLMERVPNKVASVKLFDGSGKLLKKLDNIADMEAMAMRYQKDSEPALYLRAVVSVGRSFLKQQAAGRLLGGFGKIIASGTDQFEHPDTRSWTSLPAKMLGARLRVPTGTKNLKLVTYDSSGRQLATQKIKINPNGHNFVYARSIDGTLHAQASNDLWVNSL